MWCDNCLLVLPLRAGAIAWALLIAVYSIAGGIFLFMRGEYLFFHYPEWQIYGGIGLGVGVCAVITMFALSNRSYIWSRVVQFLWPFVIVICAIRATIMIVELYRGQDEIKWECDHGGQVYNATIAATTSNGTSGSMPSAFCSVGFTSLNTAFIVSLLADIVCQIYMFFLCWRFCRRLERYDSLPGPFSGGYYFKS